MCMTLEYAVGLHFSVLFINILTKVDFMINSEEYLSTGLYYTQQAWWSVCLISQLQSCCVQRQSRFTLKMIDQSSSVHSCAAYQRERNVLRRSPWVNKYLRDLVLEVMASLSGSWEPKVRGHPEGSISYGSTHDVSVNKK